MVDQGARLAAAGRRAREQVPDARAKIDSARGAVGRDRQQQRKCDQVHEPGSGNLAGRGP